MSYRSKTHIVENQFGQGRILTGANWLADVKYNVTVTEEIRTVTALSSSTTQSVQPKQMRGQVVITNGDWDLFSHQTDGSELTLELADGRKWRFVITAANIIARRYDIQESNSDDLS